MCSNYALLFWPCSSQALRGALVFAAWTCLQLLPMWPWTHVDWRVWAELDILVLAQPSLQFLSSHDGLPRQPASVGIFFCVKLPSRVPQTKANCKGHWQKCLCLQYRQRLGLEAQWLEHWLLLKRFISTHPHGNSQPAITPVLGDLTPSSSLQWHCMHMIHILAGKTLLHKINLFRNTAE